MELTLVIAVLGLMAVTVIAAAVKQKKGGEAKGCEGCPNYSTCRAHIGCSNRNAKKEE